MHRGWYFAGWDIRSQPLCPRASIRPVSARRWSPEASLRRESYQFYAFCLSGLHREASYVYSGRFRPDWAKMSHFAVQGSFKACMLPYAFKTGVQGNLRVARLRDAQTTKQMALQNTCSRRCWAWASAGQCSNHAQRVEQRRFHATCEKWCGTSVALRKSVGQRCCCSRGRARHRA